MLLLIAMLSLLVAWLMGMCVQISGRQRCYQANSERKRRVLSTVYIGRRAVHDTRIQIDFHQLRLAGEQLAILLHNAFNND